MTCGSEPVPYQRVLRCQFGLGRSGNGDSIRNHDHVGEDAGRPHRRGVQGLKFRSVVAIALLGASAVAGAASAQPASGASPDDPSPSHERLAFFEGTWTTVESPPDVGFRETCGWMPGGRRHMVCRARWNSPTGPREGMSVFSVDGASGDVIYTGFRSGGLHVIQRGREENGRWQFHSEQGSGADRVRTRVTIAPADGGFSFVAETSKGDAPWIESARAHYRRLAP